ncbi:MAG: hypothetical protein KDE20_24560, partial [Caldilineaceae bacterium]|nr:hypothetical protein [Caldilineaceae bacterium]
GLYRKQRVAIGQVARVLSEMEQDNGSLAGDDGRGPRADKQGAPAATAPTDGADDLAPVGPSTTAGRK